MRSGSFSQAVFVHAVGAGEPATNTFTLSIARTAIGTIAAYSGVDTANPIVANSGLGTSASTSITAPSLTTTVANTHLVAFFGTAGAIGISPPAGMTERIEVASPAGVANPLTATLDDQPNPASGATGTRVATVAASSINIGQMVALRPGGGGPPPGNTAPIASNRSISTPRDTSTAVALSATDPETCELTFSIVTGPSHGTLDSIGPIACVSGAPNSDTASVLYTPAAAYAGSDSFTYRAFDGTDFSAPATVSIAVTAPGSGSIALRAVASGTNAATTSLVLPRPTGTVAGDVLVAAITVRNAPTITPPAGWTLVRRTVRSGSFSQAVFVHAVGAGEPATNTFTLSIARTAIGTIAAYSGVDTANPIVANSGLGTSASTSITAPSLTTTVANTHLVAFFGTAGAIGISPPAGMTERIEVASPAGVANPLTATLDDQPNPASGATGTRVATVAASSINIGQMVALRPAP